MGMKLRPPYDVPFWPTQNCWAYKEVWLYPGLLWLWNLAELTDAPLLTGTTEEVVSPNISFSSEQEGNNIRLRASLMNEEEHSISLRLHNVALENPGKPERKLSGTKEVVWNASVIRNNEPWVAVLVVDGNIKQRFEAIGPEI